MMQFKFDPTQEFQVRAIKSAVDLLEGQPKVKVELKFALGAGFAAVANRLDLGEEDLLTNLHKVQTSNNLPKDKGLEWIEDKIQTATGEALARF